LKDSSIKFFWFLILEKEDSSDQTVEATLLKDLWEITPQDDD